MPRLAIDPSEIRLPDYGARSRIDNAAPHVAKLRETVADLSASLEKAEADRAEALADLEKTRRRNEELRARFHELRNRHTVLLAGGLKAKPCKQIALEVTDKWGITVEELLGRSRARILVWARQEAFYEAMSSRQDLSLSVIANAFKRDHTTVLWGVGAHIERNNLKPLARTKIDTAKRRALKNRKRELDRQRREGAQS